MRGEERKRKDDKHYKGPKSANQEDIKHAYFTNESSGFKSIPVRNVDYAHTRTIRFTDLGL